MKNNLSFNDNNKIIIITFQITDDCNLNCTYCFQTNKNHHVMPLDKAKIAIDLLLQNKYSANTKNDATIQIYKKNVGKTNFPR